MSQQGVPGTVEVENGQAVRVQLASAALLDLSAAELDFTGWCGTLLVSGETRLIFRTSGSGNSCTLTFDPAPLEGADADHTLYTLPADPELAQAWTSSPPPAASGYRLTLIGGTVIGIEVLAPSLPGAEESPTPENL